MVLSFIGACLLWVGWFGFNAGSALGSGPLATSAFVNTHFAAAAAALGWTIAEWIHNGKPTALGAISGAVAGLVAITPASGFVQPILGPAHRPHRRRLLLLHGLRSQKPSSATTTRSTPLAFTAPAEPSALCSPASSPPAPSTRPSAKASPPAPSTATGARLLNQAAGVGIAWGISIVGTLVLLFLVDKIIGLRVSPEHEADGLDLSQHGEEGYDLNS